MYSTYVEVTLLHDGLVYCLQVLASTRQGHLMQALSVLKLPFPAWMWTLKQTATMTLLLLWRVLEVMRSWWNCSCPEALT